MFIRSKILRDTAILSAMQLFLDSAALLLNVFITKQLGTSAMGILSLIGSFLSIAGILSNGNAFICTSRLISEELGKSGGDPRGILIHGIRLCVLLSTVVSVGILFLSEPLCMRFFSGAKMASALRLMPFALVTGAVSACLKGYFNALRKAAVTAAAELIEFAARCGIIVIGTLLTAAATGDDVCRILIAGVIAGNSTSLVFLCIAYTRVSKKYNGKCSLTFGEYIRFSLPIMCGSLLTAFLSSTNDALIPICLRYFGDSADEALGKFGVFEAIVIPVIFFPSVVLCSMSGIIVSEAARARASDDRKRIKCFTERLKAWTLMFSVFSSAVLMRFGSRIGEILGGGELAGRMITVIAPVVPFIYMEIILEAIIKGLGMQSFSSLNYLFEYVIRIAAVLILIPRIGFYGVVISYYASNIIGNCNRFVKVIKETKARTALCGTMILPVISAFVTMFAAELPFRISGLKTDTPVKMLFYGIIWAAAFWAFFAFLEKVKLISECGVETFVDNTQQTIKRVL